MFSGIEKHSSLNIVERYHERFRGMCCKIKFIYLSVLPIYFLETTGNEMIDTLDLIEQAPFSLAFSIIPRFLHVFSPEACISSKMSTRTENPKTTNARFVCSMVLECKAQ